MENFEVQDDVSIRFRFYLFTCSLGHPWVTSGGKISISGMPDHVETLIKLSPFPIMFYSRFLQLQGIRFAFLLGGGSTRQTCEMGRIGFLWFILNHPFLLTCMHLRCGIMKQRLLKGLL